MVSAGLTNRIVVSTFEHLHTQTYSTVKKSITAAPNYSPHCTYMYTSTSWKVPSLVCAARRSFHFSHMWEERESNS